MNTNQRINLEGYQTSMYCLRHEIYIFKCNLKKKDKLITCHHNHITICQTSMADKNFV